MQYDLLMNSLKDSLVQLWKSSGIVNGNWHNYVMLAISFVLFYFAIVKKFEPLLLLPIAFGMFIINIPGAYAVLMQEPSVSQSGDAVPGGLLFYLYKGVEWVIYPPLIFLGIGAMTDFGPLIANPKSLIIGAAAQLGIFITFVLAIALGAGGLGWTDWTANEAAAISIIGGADGPTAIYVTTQRAIELLPAIAIAAYSYMALIPFIQKPIMRLLTTKKERAIKMKQLRKVSKIEKVVFPIVVTLVVGLLLPSAIPLLGMLMLGNLMRESGVVERLSSQVQNGLINTITIFLGVTVGAKALGTTFLAVDTLLIVGLGLFAFVISTVGGLLSAKTINLFSKNKINPLIGSAGVSAVPMAARVSQDVGRETDKNNHLLMHAMGPNVAGVIGSAIAAGVLLAITAVI